MKIYLDSCSLQRPLDSKTQIRIALEAEAVLAALSLCESGEFELVSSEPLIFEARRNLNVARMEYVFEVLQLVNLWKILRFYSKFVIFFLNTQNHKLPLIFNVKMVVHKGVSLPTIS